MDRLREQWEREGCDKIEITRRLVDLFFVSVLLDAGAGDVWTFTEPGTGLVYGRSEGLAVASLYMMTAGAFSGKPGENPAQVDGGNKPKKIVSSTNASLGHGLASLTTDEFKGHFQVTASNPIVADASRVSLLNRVGSSLLGLPKFFGPDGRPGQLVGKLPEFSDRMGLS